MRIMIQTLILLNLLVLHNQQDHVLHLHQPRHQHQHKSHQDKRHFVQIHADIRVGHRIQIIKEIGMNILNGGKPKIQNGVIKIHYQRNQRIEE